MSILSEYDKKLIKKQFNENKYIEKISLKWTCSLNKSFNQESKMNFYQLYVTSVAKIVWQRTSVGFQRVSDCNWGDSTHTITKLLGRFIHKMSFSQFCLCIFYSKPLHESERFKCVLTEGPVREELLFVASNSRKDLSFALQQLVGV